MTVTDRAPGPFWLRAADSASFSTRRVCAIRHNFHEHPLMQMPALAQLAKDLVPMKQCRFIRPGSTQASDFYHSADDPQGRGVEEVFRRIEEPGSWIALYNVEAVPRYRDFLEEVVSAFRPLVEPEQTGIFNVGGFIFISAPPSVTPFHIDRENNFWLQMRGRKSINVWDPSDRQAVPACEVDRFIVYAALEEVRLKDGDVERSHAFDVSVGDGVYFPSTSPHMTETVPGWTKPGDGVSVSIGVVFYTDQTRRAAYVHAWNLLLRRLGLSPSLPGESAFADSVKHPLGRLLVAFKKRLRGYKPRVGF
ncbi:MAG: cupin [Betaproteobacteria bacterium]|nr:cupin [Betaproteobacteria bacterium]